MSKKALAALMLTTGFVGAQAAVVTGGTISSASAALYSADNLVNQSGLSSGYVSGVTNFSTYLSGSPTHLGTSTSSAAGYFALAPAWVIVDLGSSRSVTDMVLWNDNDYQGVNSFSVDVSYDAGFSSFASAGNFNATYGPDGYGNPVAAQAFDLADQTGRYVRVNFLSAHQGSYVNVGEIAFGTDAANAVPEPASLALAVMALMAAGAARRRR